MTTIAPVASIAQIALSGIQAAQTRLDAAAHNIANLDTPGFRRQEVSQSPRSGGGVATTSTLARQPGPALETDLVAQLQAKNAFLANLAVFKTGIAVAGAMLDEQA
jgi:flagellar basal body rod protein FlgF